MNDKTNLDNAAATEVVDENHIIAERREKLAKLRAGGVAFPNDFVPTHLASDLHAHYDSLTKEELAAKKVHVKVAGRMVLKRVMGKASFATIQDRSGQIQFYINDELSGADVHGAFKHWDMGDFISAEGNLFKTNKGELSVECSNLRLLSKSLRPLPDKFHGLSDLETKYRQRYVDLIVNPESRNTFKARSNAIASLRRHMLDADFMEVETPMLHPIPGGAAAKPFITHHNALDMQMFLRIAPELYLKRLVVGGFERVFEINRNFRNEGADRTHSPEFAMLEAYEAYGDYNSMMVLTQELIQNAAKDVFGTHQVVLEGGEVNDLGGQWDRISLFGSLSEAVGEEITSETPIAQLKKIADKVEIEIDHPLHGKYVEELWEHFVKPNLSKPTFVLDFPVDTSPLTRDHRIEKGVVEKFDLYVRGFEQATGYSELVDPVVQRERFIKQAELAAKGDPEAMRLDEEFLKALEFGMPPSGGMGMGIDRLLMSLTGLGIRETILFPLVK